MSDLPDPFMKTVESMITPADEIKSPGKPGALRQPTVYPFLFTLSIDNGVSSLVNFPEMQGTSMQEFSIESDGEITITETNIFQLLNKSEKLVLNGEFRKEVPVGFSYPVDFVPKIGYSNSSGETRKLAFTGWLTTIAVRGRVE